MTDDIMTRIGRILNGLRSQRLDLTLGPVLREAQSEITRLRAELTSATEAREKAERERGRAEAAEARALTAEASLRELRMQMLSDEGQRLDAPAAPAGMVEAGKLRHCPTCQARWSLFKPVKCHGSDYYRCIECKAVYPGFALHAEALSSATDAKNGAEVTGNG